MGQGEVLVVRRACSLGRFEDDSRFRRSRLQAAFRASGLGPPLTAGERAWTFFPSPVHGASLRFAAAARETAKAEAASPVNGAKEDTHVPSALPAVNGGPEPLARKAP